MTRLDDPALVASEYADETRLRRRARGYAGAGTPDDARVPLVQSVVATGLSPRMVALTRERGVEALIADVQSVPRRVLRRRRRGLDSLVRASISMSPFAANVAEEIDLPLVVTRASSVFVAKKAG
ncbi:MAG TPA: hypothetical protein VGC78_13040 [Gaiellaceae bacterium]